MDVAASELVAVTAVVAVTAETEVLARYTFVVGLVITGLVGK